MQTGEHPPVQRAALCRRRSGAQVGVVHVRVRDEERVRVPQCQDEPTDDVLEDLHGDAPRSPRRARCQEEPPHRVGAEPLDDRPRVDDVAQRLRHLATLPVHDVPQTDHVAVRVLPEQQHALGHQRVEPATRLVDGLGDEVRGKARTERLGRGGILALVAPLGVRHRARVEPGVDHLGYAFRFLPALGTGQRHLIDRRPMGVDLGDVPAGQLRELGQRPDHRPVVLRADPHGQRGSPVPLAGQRPVDVVLQPVPVAAVLDVLGIPVRVLVGAQQVVLPRRRAHVPGGPGHVQQRGRTPPAQGIGVLVVLCGDQQSPCVQVLHQQRVGVLDEDPAHELRTLVGELPRVVHLCVRGPPLTPTRREVVGAESGRDVDDAGALIHRDEVGRDDAMRVAVLDVRIRRLVVRAHQERPGELVARTHVVAAGHSAQVVQPRRRDDQVALPPRRRHADVRRVGVDRQAQVRAERPRRGRPRDDGRPDHARIALGHGELDVDAGVDDLRVPERHLRIGEPGPAAGAVGGRPRVLDQQPLAVQCLQGPPHGLDVLGVHGPVRLVQVHPERDALGEAFPVRDVALDRFAAQPVELGDAERLDVALRLGADLLLHLELDRQAVAVPAALAHDGPAPHRLKARVHVLERAGLDVVDAGLPVGRGRALVEHPLGRARAQIGDALEDGALAPELEHALLERGQVHLRVHRPVCRHPAASRRPSSRGKRKRPVPFPGTRRVPRGTTLLGGSLAGPPAHRPRRPGAGRPTAVTGGARPRLLRARRPGSGGGSGRMFAGSGRRARTVPGSLRPGCPGTRSRLRH